MLALGIGLQLLSCFLAALGYVLQKSAHVLREGIKDPGPIWKSWRWLIGLTSMIASAGCAVGSAPLVPQSMQGPLGAVTIIFNSALAAVILHETLTVLDALSTTIIVTGTVLAVATNESSTEQLKFAEVLVLLNDTLVYVYTALVLIAFIVGGAFVERKSRVPFADWSAATRRTFSMAAPALGGLAMGFTGYGSKVIATVIFISDSAAFRSPGFYVYILGTGIAVFLQVRWLNAGLAVFSALSIVPVFQASIIFSNAAAGIVYLHDMRTAEPWKLVLFGVGAATCMCGVSLLLLKEGEAPQAPLATANAAKIWGEAVTPVGDGTKTDSAGSAGILLRIGVTTAEVGSHTADTEATAKPIVETYSPLVHVGSASSIVDGTSALHAVRAANAARATQRRDRVADMRLSGTAEPARAEALLAGEEKTRSVSPNVGPTRWWNQPLKEACRDAWARATGASPHKVPPT